METESSLHGLEARVTRQVVRNNPLPARSRAVANSARFLRSTGGGKNAAIGSGMRRCKSVFPGGVEETGVGEDDAVVDVLVGAEVDFDEEASGVADVEGEVLRLGVAAEV